MFTPSNSDADQVRKQIIFVMRPWQMSTEFNTNILVRRFHFVDLHSDSY